MQQIPPKQIMINEKTIQKFFKDKKSTARIFKDSQFNIKIHESTLGINIIVSLDNSLFHGLKKFKDDQNMKIVIVVFLNENYPLNPPKTFCKTKFCFPTIADGRDLTDDILQKPYMSQLTLFQFIQMFPQFIKKISQKEGDLNQMEDVGVFHINEKYDIDEILSLEGIDILETTEVTAKKSKEKRCLVLSEQHLLVFNVVNADDSIGILLNWFFLQSISKVDRKEQKFTLIFSQKKDTKLVLIFEDPDSFQSLLEKKMAQIELEVLNLQKKKSFNKEDVTAKYYENMDLKQIQENIVICENQLKNELSVNLVNTLSILYQKAIEYLSAVGDMNFKIFIDKMQDLLSREDIQSLLQIEELGIIYIKFLLQEKNKQNNPPVQEQNQPPVQVPQQIQPPVQVQDQEEQDPQYNQDYVKIQKFPCKSIDLSNQDRFVLINTNSRGDYELKRYYDNIDKRIICNKEYAISFEDQYIEEISIYEFYYDDQFIIKILDINQKEASIKFQDGQTNLQGYKQQREKMSPLTEDEIFTIALRIISLLKYCRTHQIFPANFTDIDLVFEPTSIYNEFQIKFGPSSLFYKIDRMNTQQIINRAYYKQEFLDLILNKKQLKTDIAILNCMFTLGRILQKLMLKEDEQDLFKRANIEEFIVRQKERYPLLIQLVGSLLTKEFKDYEEIESVIYQLVDGKEFKQTITDLPGACQICYENLLFNPIQIMLKKSIIKKYQYHEIHNLKPPSIYFLNLIGDPKSDQTLQKLIFSHQVPSLAVLLQKYTENPNLQLEKILIQFKNIFTNYPNINFDQKVFDKVELNYSYQFFTFGIYMVLLLTRMGFLSTAQILAESLILSAREIYQDYHLILSDIIMVTSYVYKQQGLYNLSLQLACESYIIRKQLQIDNHATLFFSSFFISRILLYLKKNEFALEWSQNLPLDWKNTYIYNRLEIQGRCMLEQKQLQNAFQLFTQAQKTQDLNYFQQIKIQQLIGKTYMMAGKNQEAINYAIQASILAKKVLSTEEHPYFANCLHFIGKIMLKSKLYEESAKYHLKALVLRQKILGENHLDISTSYCNLGKVYFQTRELDESIKYFSQGLQIRIINSSLQHLKSIVFIEHLIYIYTQQHKEDNLLDLYSQYDEVYMNVYGNSSDNYIHFLQRKAEILEKVDGQLGIEIREQILNFLKNNQNSDKNEQLKITQQIINMGINYHQNSLFEKALEMKKEGYEKAKILLGEKSFKLIQIQLSLLETCKELNLYDESIQYFQQALQLSKDINLEEEQVVKIINQMANFCVDLMGQVKLEDAFSLNDKIQVAITAVYGDSSPYLEMQSQIMQNSMNSII